MESLKKQLQYGEQTLTIETGHIARQANGSAYVTMGGTVVLVTAVAKENAESGKDFLPLTVNYQERTYAAGKIPGGFFKREGKPTETETLNSRLIDRPLRPLFPEGFYNDVQVVATVLSHDTETDPDIPAMIGASAALALSGIPIKEPMAAARVGYKDGQYLLNPSSSQLEQSQLDLVVAGTQDNVLMVESEASELPEDVMLEAVMHGSGQMQPVIDVINDMAKEHGKPRWDWQPPEYDQLLADKIAQVAEDRVKEAYQITDKLERKRRVDEIKKDVVDNLADEENGPSEDKVADYFSELEANVVRYQVMNQQQRIDGRQAWEVRPIDVDTGFLPRAHGSAVFTRGETQAIVTATLGSERDAKIIDDLWGERKEPFMLHYNFPPYCVGEVGFMGAPKRREIGHGSLAKRSLKAVVPSMEDFPYVLRAVSEITESNGSSSMATVCGTSLALMDAGVPLKAPVAGVAMGLMKQGDQHMVLTDILGDEDHLGDMDFKVAGTEQGVTSLQMDIKISGITRQIMHEALTQARQGRMHVLNVMNKHLDKPRSELSPYAPRIMTLQINPEKIRDVIGKGGATIREITEETGATIDITDEGLVKIWASDGEAGEKAKEKVKDLTAEAKVGEVYQGKITKVLDFGAFVNILPGQDGLLHISQIAEERIENIHDRLEQGQTVNVKVIEIDRQGRIKLSMKSIEAHAEA